MELAFHPVYLIFLSPNTNDLMAVVKALLAKHGLMRWWSTSGKVRTATQTRRCRQGDGRGWGWGLGERWIRSTGQVRQQPPILAPFPDPLPQHRSMQTSVVPDNSLAHFQVDPFMLQRFALGYGNKYPEDAAIAFLAPLYLCVEGRRVWEREMARIELRSISILNLYNK